MLGFSLPKLIVLGLIIAAIWYGFKMFGSGRLAFKSKVSKGEDSKAAGLGAVDMVQCKICNDFVSIESTTFCGKSGCPYPR
jgi:hypothetical protein